MDQSDRGACGDLDTKAARVETWYKSLWEDHDTSVLEDALAPDVVMTGPMTRLIQGGTNPLETVNTFLSVIKCQIDATFDQIEEQGDWVFGRLTLRFYAHPYRPEFFVPALLVVKMPDQHITEVHFSMNYVELFEGLGQMPEDTLVICLSGAELVWK